MAKQAKHTIFELTKPELIDVVEMVIETGDNEVDAATFDKLVTGPKFAELMDQIADELQDAWYEMAHDIVSDYVEDNLEVPA